MLRRTQLRRWNIERLKRLQAEQFGKEEAELVRSLPCCGCGRKPRSQSHHVNSRGAGGKKDAQAPLCQSNPYELREGCHDELGRLGRKTWEAKHKISLARVAALVSDKRVTAATFSGSPAEVARHWRELADKEMDGAS